MLELDGFVEASVDAETLTASCELVGLGDPADRILAAAARIHDLLFITRDGKILEYGAAGHLRVMEC
jgi:PIN domain nuclease of toxin-antitoxin system